MHNFIFSLFYLLLTACSSTPAPEKVPSVEIPRFMGRWYVIANIPTFIERDAHNAVETYSWNESKQRIDVLFTFNQGSFTGPKKSYSQKAFIHDPSGNEWRIQFFWPLRFPYLILDLDPNYEWTVIGVPNRSYLWIMARSPFMEEDLYQQIIDRVKVQGFATEKIQRVPQNW